VNWNFLLDCCKQKGFSEKWLTWISNAMTGGTLSVKVNDNIGLTLPVTKELGRVILLPQPCSMLLLIVWPK
jgi:hypothetical protein